MRATDKEIRFKYCHDVSSLCGDRLNGRRITITNHLRRSGGSRGRESLETHVVVQRTLRPRISCIKCKLRIATNRREYELFLRDSENRRCKRKHYRSDECRKQKRESPFTFQ